MSSYRLLTGPILIGSQLNWCLLGILAAQVYFFHITFPRERRLIKAIVYILFALDLLQTALSSHFAFELLVSFWGDPTIFLQQPWSSATIPVMAGFISVIVQLFFAWRIYILKRGNPWFTITAILIAGIALMQSLSAIVNGIRYATISLDIATIISLDIGVKIWLIGSFACDILIAAGMLTILAQARKQSPYAMTDSIMTKLIISTVETGALTALTAGINLLLYLLYGDTLTYDVPSFILGKMYSNVMLASLNGRARSRIQASAGGVASSAFTVPGQNGESHQLALRGQTTTTERQLGVKVHVDTVTHREDREFSGKRNDSMI
ncbi:hypothetical protein C8J57DRAFT_262325 [Mycena rebaudengoi]|nr:hypothetical protein C8J57DRAFT_262325 [Mycena rebaudengoi]